MGGKNANGAAFGGVVKAAIGHADTRLSPVGTLPKWQDGKFDPVIGRDKEIARV